MSNPPSGPGPLKLSPPKKPPSSSDLPPSTSPAQTLSPLPGSGSGSVKSFSQSRSRSNNTSISGRRSISPGLNLRPDSTLPSENQDKAQPRGPSLSPSPSPRPSNIPIPKQKQKTVHINPSLYDTPRIYPADGGYPSSSGANYGYFNNSNSSSNSRSNSANASRNIGGVVGRVSGRVVGWLGLERLLDVSLGTSTNASGSSSGGADARRGRERDRDKDLEKDRPLTTSSSSSSAAKKSRTGFIPSNAAASGPFALSRSSPSTSTSTSRGVFDIFRRVLRLSSNPKRALPPLLVLIILITVLKILVRPTHGHARVNGMDENGVEELRSGLSIRRMRWGSGSAWGFRREGGGGGDGGREGKDGVDDEVVVDVGLREEMDRDLQVAMQEDPIDLDTDLELDVVSPPKPKPKPKAKPKPNRKPNLAAPPIEDEDTPPDRDISEAEAEMHRVEKIVHVNVGKYRGGERIAAGAEGEREGRGKGRFSLQDDKIPEAIDDLGHSSEMDDHTPLPPIPDEDEDEGKGEDDDEDVVDVDGLPQVDESDIEEFEWTRNEVTRKLEKVRKPKSEPKVKSTQEREAADGLVAMRPEGKGKAKKVPVKALKEQEVEDVEDDEGVADVGLERDDVDEGDVGYLGGAGGRKSKIEGVIREKGRGDGKKRLGGQKVLVEVEDIDESGGSQIPVKVEAAEGEKGGEYWKKGKKIEEFEKRPKPGYEDLEYGDDEERGVDLLDEEMLDGEYVDLSEFTQKDPASDDLTSSEEEEDGERYIFEWAADSGLRILTEEELYAPEEEADEGDLEAYEREEEERMERHMRQVMDGEMLEEEIRNEGECRFISPVEAYQDALVRLRTANRRDAGLPIFEAASEVQAVDSEENGQDDFDENVSSGRVPIDLSHPDLASHSPPHLPHAHTYSSTGHLLISNHSQAQHPIPQLLALGERRWEEMINRQSRNLGEAVEEYKRRYGRAPPKGFDIWWDFAQTHSLLLPDEYDRIHLDLAPFWALPRAEMRRRVREAMNLNETFVLVVENGNVSVEVLDEGGLTWGGTLPRAKDAANLIRPFTKHLPDMRAVFSIHDQPQIYQSWARRNSLIELGLKGEHTKHLHESDSSDVRWERSCAPDSNLKKHVLPDEAGSLVYDAVEAIDICQNPYLMDRHGLTVAKQGPASHPKPRTSLLPVFGLAKTTVNSDILVTPLDQFADAPGFDPPWRYKPSSKVVWRGSTTGISWMDQNAPWRKSHRFRLHDFAQNQSEALFDYYAPDVGVDGGPLLMKKEENEVAEAADFFYDMKLAGQPLQCDEKDGTCDIMRETVDFAEHQPAEELNDYKFLFDIDGNSWSGRFRRLMDTRSLVLKTGLFTEWFQPHLIPWFSYIPVRLDFTDLPVILGFLRGTPKAPDDGFDEVAEALANNGRCFVKKMFRHEDLQAYMFRLFLEYARLMAPTDEDVDFVFDPSMTDEADISRINTEQFNAKDSKIWRDDDYEQQQLQQLLKQQQRPQRLKGQNR